MKRIEVLYGRSEAEQKKEIELIESNAKSKEQVCYVLDNNQIELAHYIDYLHDYNVKNKILYRLHICKQIVLDGNVTYIPRMTKVRSLVCLSSPRIWWRC